ncbi:Gustatory receptor 14b [Ladona fulva]|uniref:Gustatory receptor n=1 Tax=Ladona fulva TaxID=123851 RepID=A0A8K0K9H5_LADFU|nr:Gustatory receptor 14b [Ladona fulva]
MDKEKREDLLWALSPMFKINTFTGISPFAVERNAKPRRWTVTLHYLLFTLLVFLSAFNCFRFVIQSTSYDQSESETKYVRLVWSTTDLVAGILCAYIHLLKQRRVRRVFLDVVQLGEMLPEDALCASRIRRSVQIQSVLFISMALNSAMISFWISKLFGFAATGMHIFFTQYFLLVHIQSVWQFYVAIFLLRKCFAALNFEIRSMILESILRERLFHGLKQPSLSEDLSLLRKVHLRACEASKSAASVYGIQIVLLAFYNVLRICFTLYSCVDSKVFRISDEFDLPLKIDLSSWIITHSALQFLVVYATEKLYGQSDKTGKLVSEMILKVKDHRIRRELHLFSLQLLHTKFHFTACGFFPLDFTLLTSMAAAVVTYLVILVQFQESEKAVTKLSCNCSHNILTENGTM